MNNKHLKPGYYWVKYFQAWVIAEVVEGGEMWLHGQQGPVNQENIKEIGAQIPDNKKLKRLIKIGDSSPEVVNPAIKL